MADRVLKNVTKDGRVTDIEITDGKISYIGKSNMPGEDKAGLKAYPGLIDIHTHGAIGFEVTDGGHLSELSDYYSSEGVTAWYPTTVTDSIEQLRTVTRQDTVFSHGAKIQGFHLEGPYISKIYKGAQKEECIKNPDLSEFSKFTDVKLITLAPELPGAFEFIENCGCKAVIGHSAADYDTALRAIKCGANCLTHTFNAMTPLHHRNPGIIGAAIDGDAYAQVICDGLHVHQSVVKALYRIFGNKMIVISDSRDAAGMPDGEYESGIIVKNGECRLLDGTLAGGSHSVLYGVKKLISWGIPEKDAFNAASLAPAEYMGLNKGKIKEGFDADIILLDEKLSLKETIIGGVTDHVCRN